MRIIIAGGSGLIGSALCSALIDHGDQVTILSRNPAKVTGLPAGTMILQWDGKTIQNWANEIQHTDGVINLTGENLSGEKFFPSRWTRTRKERLLTSRENSGMVLSKAIELAGKRPEVFVQASGINYYDTQSNAEATEETGPGDDFLANLSKKWEASSEAVESFGVRRIVIRNGIVLSKRKGALPLLLLPYKLFAGGRLGTGKQVYSWIHMDDEVNAILYLIHNQNANGVFNLTSPEPVTNDEFGRTIGKVMKRPHYFPIPGFALKIAFGEVAKLVIEGRQVVPKRLMELGYSFLFPTLNLALKDLIYKP